MSWWNPFSWTPGGEGAPDREDSGIWGGPGDAGGGLHAGTVLGEGSMVGYGPDGGGQMEAAVPSDLVVAYGTVGTGVRSDVLGGLRTIGAGLSESGEAAWRVLTATPLSAAQQAQASKTASDVGAGLDDARALGEAVWRSDVAGADQVGVLASGIGADDWGGPVTR